jgi:hypothetical protein
VSRELDEEVALELRQLRHMLETFDPLLRKVRSQPPDGIEVVALAGMLHSFYTGVENLFKRFAVHLDGGPPRGEAWHIHLLESMASATGSRAPVISASLRDRLQNDLDFRHVFRHAYPFEIRWQKMAPLALNCRTMLDSVESEIHSFLAQL